MEKIDLKKDLGLQLTDGMFDNESLAKHLRKASYLFTRTFVNVLTLEGCDGIELPEPCEVSAFEFVARRLADGFDALREKGGLS